MRDSYWDTETTSESEAVGEDDGKTTNVEGMVTEDMHGDAAQYLMDELNFNDTWDVVVDPDDYPALAAIDADDQLGGRD